VAVLVDQRLEGGLYAVPFAAGRIPDGVYFYRIQMDYLTFTKRMVVLR
jgi:hypothetical protein